MCGINGIFHFEKSKPIAGEIEKMNQAIAFRGPDAEGYFKDLKVELGHRRLSIIDVSQNANQPIKSSDENWVIVFNGELYNYTNIKSQLSDYSFKTNSDTEVVLAAWMKWGEHSLRIFNGIFSFAIYDCVKSELFVVRDRLGVKPLYYFASNDVLMFSSGVKAILATDRSSRKISKRSLIDYLRYQTVHAPQTLIEDIHVLMPGHLMKVNEEEGIQIKSYWNSWDANSKRFANVNEVHKAVRDQLFRSVELQLVADVPFGAFLSGGIDSSILVATMAQLRAEKPDTFSVVFKEAEFSEAKYARLIAEKFQTKHHEINLSVSEFKDLIPDALTAMDHPSGDGPNTFVVSKKTREAGVKMALSGLGGDELFAGYSVFTQLPELKSKKWLRSFPAYGRRPMARIYKNIKGTIAASKISALLSLEEFEIENIYPIYRQVFMDNQVVKLSGLNKLPPNEVFEITKNLVGYKQVGSGLPLLSKISLAEINTYMQNVLLRDADQMSMANSLEVRVPFLDHDLVSLALGIDDIYKNPTTPKKLLVDAFSDLLPKEIYDRPKMGFVLPYEKWMKEELRSFCEERINYLAASNHFSSDNVKEQWNSFLKGSKKTSWSRIWILVVLAHWMKENNVN